MQVGYNLPIPQSLEDYFGSFVLPTFGVTGNITWEQHVQTAPDNFLHIFRVNHTRYALAFDDYPSGFSVEGEPFVKVLHLENGDSKLYIDAPYTYVENVTGYFMLFQVTDGRAFDEQLVWLNLEYEKLRKQWSQSPRKA